MNQGEDFGLDLGCPDGIMNFDDHYADMAPHVSHKRRITRDSVHPLQVSGFEENSEARSLSINGANSTGIEYLAPFNT